MSEAAGRDVGIEEAVADYVASVLHEKPDEARILSLDPDVTGMLELDALARGEDEPH